MKKIESSVDMFDSLIIVYSEMMEKDKIIDAIFRDFGYISMFKRRKYLT